MPVIVPLTCLAQMLTSRERLLRDHAASFLAENRGGVSGNNYRCDGLSRGFACFAFSERSLWRREPWQSSCPFSSAKAAPYD